MPTITLRDILIHARQESHRMRHFYIGAEHLFTAILEIKGSVTGKIVQEFGLTPEYVIDAIRRKIGKGSRHRLWAGIPNTPRADVILSIANDIALENGRNEISERDLLIALLDERESLPVRVLDVLGIGDLDRLREMAKSFSPDSDSQQPYVKVDFGPNYDHSDSLSREQLFILRRMFYGYNQIRVDSQLKGGYSDALLLVITPINIDGREDASVVVKIGNVDSILDEARRYNLNVKAKLPAMTARLEDKPVAPETSDLAGLKYTLIAGYDRTPKALWKAIEEWDDPLRLGSWLENELFPVFGRLWWQQSRPYRFQIWREYDWLLPPILTLEMVKGQQAPANVNRLRVPVKRARLTGLEYGDIVSIENFIVQKVDVQKKTLILAAGQGSDAAGAYKIEMRNVDLATTTYYRGEVVESMLGRIWKTRSEQLIHTVNGLDPDFDPKSDRIPAYLTGVDTLPNPIKTYSRYLEDYVNGTLSVIHGDMHPSNIMVGPNQSAFLIDFAHTREGHSLFDWAMLETSLLASYVLPKAGESWANARDVLQQVARLNSGSPLIKHDVPFSKAMVPLINIRHIVRQCLTDKNSWAEYHVALAFNALRAVSWETLSVGSRRLMFLLAALSMQELNTQHRLLSDSGTPSPEETDISTA